ncbi:MAG: 50S ribosomal protein L13 [Dehalococcoidales bacterium]|nr:50S ribosomal protein L13 [Dehalococcoidales bacterium]
MKSYTAKPADIQRAWHLFDATDKTLGRFSTQIARLLMGKHKPIFTPSMDTGDYVVIINAEKVRVTGRKAQQKMYYRHSGYPGGFKSITLGKMMKEFPTRALEHSINGMIPHTRLGSGMKKRLRIFAGPEHPHASQITSDTTKGAK